MKLQSLLFCVLMICGFTVAKADQICPQGFHESTYSDVFKDDGQRIQFPAKLFKSFEKYIHVFDAKACAHAIEEVKTQVDGRQYTALYSIEDECDGGNSYGLILDGEKHVIGFISDSEIVCFDRMKDNQAP